MKHASNELKMTKMQPKKCFFNRTSAQLVLSMYYVYGENIRTQRVEWYGTYVSQSCPSPRFKSHLSGPILPVLPAWLQGGPVETIKKISRKMKDKSAFHSFEEKERSRVQMAAVSFKLSYNQSSNFSPPLNLLYLQNERHIFLSFVTGD